MKRAVAVAAASIDAVKAVHASVIQDRNERRGIEALAAGVAGLAGVAGFGAAGFGGVVESSILLIRVSRIKNYEHFYENFFSASSEASRTARSGSLWLSASILS